MSFREQARRLAIAAGLSEIEEVAGIPVCWVRTGKELAALRGYIEKEITR